MSKTKLKPITLSPEEQIALLHDEIDFYLKTSRYAKERIEEIEACLKSMQNTIDELKCIL